MNASQFRTNLVAFAIFEANKALASIDGRDCKAAMLRHACTLTDAQKREEDRHIVGAIEARFGLKATPSERPQYSGMTFDKTAQRGEAAAKALQRARAMLKPSTSDEAEALIAKMMVTVANSADPVATLLGRFEKLTGGQKRSFLAKLNAR